jgi:Cu2+-exporting ATPase
MPAPSTVLASAGRAPVRSAAADDPIDAARCFHCGAPNPARSDWHAELNGASRRFCCAGCLAVAQTIHAAGLERFYAARTAVLARPDDADVVDEWVRHDEVAAAAGLVRSLPDGRQQASLLLENLTCGACVWLIESWLARRPGVLEARVNYASRRAHVVWREGEARLSDVLRAIAAIGYRAHPYDPARREDLARRERRSLLLRMAIALLGMMQVMMFAVPTYIGVDGVEPEHRKLLHWASLTLTLPVLVYSAAPFFRGAWRDLRFRRLGMDVPVALGLAAAFIASAASTLGEGGPVYYDSVTMFVALLLAARYVELAARQRAGEAVEAVARAQPAAAEQLFDDGTVRTVAAASLAPGERVLVRAGATIPADGTVLEGSSHVEEAMLTGESWPRAKHVGDAVLAGAVNRDSALVVQVAAAGEGTRLAAVLRLVEKAAGERPRVARIADRAAAWFVGGLLVLAAITAFVWWHVDPSRALAVTFALLVVSCPCALSLATPAALAAAAGALGQRQVVLTRADAMEALARVTHVALDKTGTLTEGNVRVGAVESLDGRSSEEALRIAAALELRSEHPIARAIVSAATAPLPVAGEVIATPGQGIAGIVERRRFRIGRMAFVAEVAGAVPPEVAAFGAREGEATTLVGLGSDEGWCALIALGDTLRAGARRLVDALHETGVQPILLSGDRQQSVAAIARELSIADARGDLTPEDKRNAIVALQREGAVVAMVGDGINDAPSLAQAQVSVSLGSATPLAQWTADVVVLSDDIARIGEAIAIARRVLRVVRQNLAWATLYNAIAIPTAAFGLVTPLAAAAGMSISSLVVVLNAVRLARVPHDAPASKACVVAPAPSPRR